MLSIIACISKVHRAIGYKNRLLYAIPSDMTRFRMLTTGHTIIMGRKTFESLPNGALPNRRNIVISKTREQITGCEVFSSLEEALAARKEEAGNKKRLEAKKQRKKMNVSSSEEPAYMNRLCLLQTSFISQSLKRSLNMPIPSFRKSIRQNGK